MRIRLVGLGVRMAILLLFATFFIAPVLWLVLAPTKSDKALITSSPFSFGDFHHVALAWKHLNAFSDHVYRRWIGNTLYYTLSATGDHARASACRRATASRSGSSPAASSSSR